LYPELQRLLKIALDYLFATSFARFCSGLVVLGLAALGLNWVDVFLLVADRTLPGRDSTEPGWVPLVNYGVPSLVIFIGIALRLWVAFRESRTAKVTLDDKEKKAAAALIASLESIALLYSGQVKSRDSGFGIQNRLDAQSCAKAYLAIETRGFSGDSVLSIVSNPTVDADQRTPYYKVSVEEISGLVSRLRASYAIN
jgi:hypothetical protein